MTSRGPAEKCEFEPLCYDNFFFAVQRGPRIAPNFMFFSEGPSGGVFLTSGRPKMPAEADFGRFCADSGPPFGPTCGTFRNFFWGRNFDRCLIEFRGLIRRGRRQGVGLRKLIPSLQTPNHPFVSEGHRKEISSRFTPRRGAANLERQSVPGDPRSLSHSLIRETGRAQRAQEAYATAYLERQNMPRWAQKLIPQLI